MASPGNLVTNICQNGFNVTTPITSFPSKRSYTSDDPHEPDQTNNEWEVDDVHELAVVVCLGVLVGIFWLPFIVYAAAIC